MICEKTAVALLVVALSAGCAESDEICNEVALRRALVEAASGETVHVGACAILLSDTIVVPAGVSLNGVSARASRFEVSPYVRGVELSTGSSLGSLAIHSRGQVAVLARDASDITLRDLRLEALYGIGVYARDVEGLAVTDVVVTGPVTASNASTAAYIEVAANPYTPGTCVEPSCECSPGDADLDASRVCDQEGNWQTWTATHGVVLESVSATVNDLSVNGFALVGLSVGSSNLVARDLRVEGNLGVGVYVSGGTHDVSEAVIRSTFRGLRGDPSYGLVVTEAESLVAGNLQVSENEQFGLLNFRSSVDYENAVIESNADVGLWIGESDSVRVHGPGTRISANRFAGVVVSDSSRITVEDAQVAETAVATRFSGLFGELEVGDGLHVSHSYDSIVLRSLRLDGNARTGLSLDLGAALDRLPTLEGIVVSAEGESFGAVAGALDDATSQLQPTTSVVWDLGVTRSGAAIVNDVRPPRTMDAVINASPGAPMGVIAPMY